MTDGGQIVEVEGETIFDGLPAGDLLREIVRRAERLEDEIANLQADRREVLAEGKARGLDPKALREVLRRRKIEHRVRADLDAMVEIYESALGGTPRGMIEGGELRRPAAQLSGGSAGLRAALIWAGAK